MTEHPKTSTTQQEKISDITYAIPFGQYSGSKEVDPKVNEVLVGREPYRAYMIDLLLSSGRRGAFLVTGRRGAGKTSFVEHCVAEYEEAVFKRFLRQNVGKTLWDRALVVAFWAIILLAGLLLSELAQLLSPISVRGPHQILLWLLLVPVGVILLAPCVYARAVFEAILKTARRSKIDWIPGGPRAATVAVLLVLSLCVLLWFVPKLGSPSWATSALVLVLSALYLGCQFAGLESTGETGRERRSRPLKRWPLLSVLLIPVTVAFVFRISGHVVPTDMFSAMMRAPLIHLCFALLMLAGGMTIRGQYQVHMARALGQAQAGTNPTAAFQMGAWSYLLPAVALAAVGSFLGILAPASDRPFVFGPQFPSLAAVALPLVFVVLTWIKLRRCRPATLTSDRIEQVGCRFRPFPLTALGAGAIVSIVLALQLAHPILNPLFDHTTEPMAGTLSDRLGIASEPDGSGPGRNAVLSLASTSGLRQTGTPQDPEFEGAPVFWHRFEGILWIVLALFTLCLLHYIHYEWIVRPYASVREDGPLDPEDRSPWDDRGLENLARDKSWRSHRLLASLTLPWSVYRFLLPTAVVSINLGFESKLGAGHIIQAMLAGLRSVYHRTFTSWRAIPANVGRIVLLLGVVVLATLASDVVFKLPPPGDVDKWARADSFRQVSDHAHACAVLRSSRHLREVGAYDLLCWLSPAAFDLMYLDLAPTQLGSTSLANTNHPLDRGVKDPKRRVMGSSPGERLVLYALLPYTDPVSSDALATSSGVNWARTLPSGLHFNVHHLLFFLLFTWIGRSITKRFPLNPYRATVRRIDDLLDAMTSRTRITQRPSLLQSARWIYSIVIDRVRETEREPLDPRTVELALLQILHDSQELTIRLPWTGRSPLNLPTPEITFVFDELDKLGTRLDPELGDIAPHLHAEYRALQADQERALKLRGLLADLKNILSSAPARFIFIGGRNLHDEWLADQTARQPLLTNIFVAEVYLPSLLVDKRRPCRIDSNVRESPHRLHTRIEEYVVRQYERAETDFEKTNAKHWTPSSGLGPSRLTSERFGVGRPKRVLPHVEIWQIGGAGLQAPEKPRLLQDFVYFLTLRSMGNPKRLREMLARFVRPVHQELRRRDQEIQRWGLGCQHILRFRDIEIFRVQLIASIYRHLAARFEPRMAQRDDKMAISIFFLSDFIFKFHRRAFTWMNLERVDELTHIHRAPDLREVQEEIVDLYSERFLHRVLNGMYSFRFRSDIAREVEFLSRRSPPEMAALNFTLDESQSLKAFYRRALDLREKAEGAAPSLVSGLGELYEFDQEYETARFHYRQAIDIADRRLCEHSGSPTAVKDLLQGKHEGMEDARIFLPWGEVRLRLMLQIGMTFELTRDLEHAVTEYRAARTLARALVRAFLGLDLHQMQYWWTSKETFPRDSGGRHHALKHMTLLAQPIFAEAWASQKLSGAVDTASSLIERSVAELTKTLPFVREGSIQVARQRSNTDHANLALTVSQIHNKAGDHYFFKGRQAVLWRHMVDKGLWRRLVSPKSEGPEQDRPVEGYLLMAHYHYALGLFRLRHFNYYRLASSEARLRISKAPAKTLTPGQLPDFLWRAAAGSLNDMAEATIGRTSILGLLPDPEDPSGHQETLENPDKYLYEALLQWLSPEELSPSEIGKEATGAGIPDEEELWIQPEGMQKPMSLGKLGNWLGRWRGESDENGGGLIEFDGPDGSRARLLVGIYLCRTGARFFRDGGYLEDAARELLQVSEIVSRILWWIRALHWLERRCQDICKTAHETMDELRGTLCGDQTIAKMIRCGGIAPLLRHLLELQRETLEEIGDLFCQARPPLEGLDDRTGTPHYKIGDQIPPEIARVACDSLVWITGHLDLGGEIHQRHRTDVEALLETWCGGPGKKQAARDRLRASLRHHRFPILNRLHGLETLINDFSLEGPCRDPEDGLEQACSDLEELLELNEQYAAPFHFTPQQSGTTCALFYLSVLSRIPTIGDEKLVFLDRIYRIACRDLRKSEEMYTLRRSFYESVSDLYYLYDDFNDRQIHFRHALQMAGAELTALLRTLLKVTGPPKRAVRSRCSSDTAPA